MYVFAHHPGRFLKVLVLEDLVQLQGAFWNSTESVFQGHAIQILYQMNDFIA